MTHAQRVILLITVLCACRSHNALGPSEVAVHGWSPFVGVHAFAAFENVQQPYLEPLITAHAVRGIRLDMNGPDAEYFAGWAESRGADVLGIFPNEYLRSPDADDALIDMMRRNPSVRFWEIGNEIDVFTDMTVPEYIPIFLRLHARAEAEFPDNVVINQAPCGGCDGADQVRQMLDGGLLRLAREGRLPVFSVHYYSNGSPYLSRLKRQIQRLPGSTQVWVTESGIDSHDRHQQWVETEYQRVRSQLRATRIYWYVFSECSEFALVEGIASACPSTGPKLSPLYQLLTHPGGAS